MPESTKKLVSIQLAVKYVRRPSAFLTSEAKWYLSEWVTCYSDKVDVSGLIGTIKSLLPSDAHIVSLTSSDFETQLRSELKL